MPRPTGSVAILALVAALLVPAPGRGQPNAESTAAKAAAAKVADLTTRCDKKKHGASCTALGELMQAGRGVTRDLPRAVTLFLKACDLKDGLGCVRLGEMYQSGRGIPPDEDRAAALFLKACGRGTAEGCTLLGRFYEEGEGEENGRRAREQYQRACKGKNPAGCLHVALCHERGVGVEKDKARALLLAEAAVALYVKACDAGKFRACRGLAVIYAAGLGVTKDLAKAAERAKVEAEKIKGAVHRP